MRIASKDLESYLGSQHSAVGLLLFYLGVAGLLAFGFMLTMEMSTTDFTSAGNLPAWSFAIFIWAIVAVPLGFSMRKSRPPQLRWILANAWLVGPFLCLVAFRIIG